MGKTLLILAAGMGSRYGGLKQFDRLGPSGETIMDYSVYDAVRAGFDRVVFVIRRDFEAEFKEVVGERYSKYIKVDYAFQSLDDLPAGFTLPPGREKPWGTAHAVYAARELLTEPFGVINADDFYGADSYRQMASYFDGAAGMKDGKVQGCIVSFVLERTMSENGSVSRGICAGGKYLESVEEHTKIFHRGGRILSEISEGAEVEFTGQEPVSMNCWGFMPEFAGKLEKLFALFLEKNIAEAKKEFFLPGVVDTLIRSGEADIAMLRSGASWFGVTYREDRPKVQQALKSLVDAGEYPAKLFD